MQKLKKIINKNGFEYRLHTRGRKTFIYEQTGKTCEGEFRIFAYEVFQKIVDPEKESFGKIYPIRERFPADSDFGKWAWTYSTIESAEQKFNELENS